ncbi:MAG: hypothetical protein ACRC4N_13670, partial [Gammaproteobacteria bacterium]
MVTPPGHQTTFKHSLVLSQFLVLMMFNQPEQLKVKGLAQGPGSGPAVAQQWPPNTLPATNYTQNKRLHLYDKHTSLS